MRLIKERILGPLALSLLVAACGGGGGSSGGQAPPTNQPPPGSSGGTRAMLVSGAITGFGSVIVNGVRYDTDTAEVRIEDRAGTISELKVGQVVRLEAQVDDRGGGRATRIERHHLLQGVVQSVDVAGGTLTVSGQVVIVDGDTSFDDSIVPATLAGVAVGDRIEVHGFVASNGQARATRIEKSDAGETEVEVKGLVSGHDPGAKRFHVGNLVVDYSTAALERFGSEGPRDGDLVEVEGREVLVDGALRASRVEKEDGGIRGVSGHEAEVEGLVTRFVSPADFDVAGLRVTATSATTFLGGSAVDLALDVKVEAEGRLDASGVLVATKVEFKRSSSVQLEARVDAVDPSAGTLRVLGLTVVVDASTRKEDKQGDDQFFALDDLRVGDWVEVAGFADPATSGRIVATRLERDDPEDEVELRGSVDSLEAPRLRIVGVNVETTPGTGFEDEDLRIDAATFFERAAGQVVEVDGSWDGATLTAREAEIEREGGM